jgi:hypothetical protein
MKRWLLVASLVGSVGTARAQAPGASEPVASFLERRVPEELAAEGVVLSRRGLKLHIDQVGDVLILSLVDVSTGRVAASTKLDAVPADREAAVATTTHLVADLATQVTPSAPAPAPPPPAAPAPDTHAREIAELQFRREAIRFGNDYEISVSKYGGSVHRQWVAVQGELDQRLDPHEFYRQVGRPDLADAYDTRHNVMIGGYVVGGVGFAASFVAYLAMRPTLDDSSCVVTDPGFQTCEAAADMKFHNDSNDALLVSLGAMGVGAIGLGVGLWYHYHPHPISENEAKQLADQHNQTLRRTLGLPVADVHLTPIANGSTSGFALIGRF